MKLPAIARVLALGACLVLPSACISYHAYRKCGRPGCAGDAEITAQIQALLGRHPDLGPPNQIYVQTSDRVVFLTGQVATELQRANVEAIAREAPQVRQIINNVAINFEGR